MGLFEKSKEKEIQRLRSAGLSLAHANRAAQSRRGNGAVLTLVGGAGVVLVGAIAVLALQMDTPPPAPQASAPVAAMENLVAPPPPASISIAEQQAEQRKAELAAAIEMAMAKEAEQKAAQAVIAQIPTATTSVEVEPIPATLQNEDCVAKLDSYLAPLFVQFDLGSTLINAENAALLTRISDQIITCEDAYVMIAGHTDSSGDDTTNMTLSWERADRTLNRLVELGVNPNAVEAVGFGARAPLAQGSVEEDGADRRVDFRVSRIREDQR